MIELLIVGDLVKEHAELAKLLSIVSTGVAYGQTGKRDSLDKLHRKLSQRPDSHGPSSAGERAAERATLDAGSTRRGGA